MKKSKFNLKDTFNQEVEMHTEFNDQTYTSIQKIREKVFHYQDLIANEKNRSVNHNKVLSIAESIEANGRMIDKPQVTLLENGKALLWAGHHRTAAIKYLVEEKGLKEYEYIKCDILENNALDNEILMIDTNLEREELSLYDKMMAIGRKEELYHLKKQKKEIDYSGSARAYIAQASKNLEETQVGVNLRVYKKAGKQVKKALKDEKITLTQAYKLAALPNNEQVIELNKILKLKKSIQKQKEQQDILLENLQLQIQNEINMPVSLKKNMLTFKFKDLDHLFELLDILGFHDMKEKIR